MWFGHTEVVVKHVPDYGTHQRASKFASDGAQFQWSLDNDTTARRSVYHVILSIVVVGVRCI
jgi:hypothetical protein